MNLKEKENFIEKEDSMRKDYCKDYEGRCSRSHEIETDFSPEEIENWEKRIFVVSGPPGSGKDTVVEECMKKDAKLEYFIPMTTRQARPGEKDIRYHFEDAQTFENQMDKDEFLFWQDHGKDAEGNQKYYGIKNSDLRETLTNSDNDVVITVGGICGSMEIKRIFPKSTCIFISPSSLETLEKQIRGRGTDSNKEIELRLKEGQTMMKYKDLYDFAITNVYGELDKTVETALKTIQERRER